MPWEPGGLVNQTWRAGEGGEQGTELGIVEAHSFHSTAKSLPPHPPKKHQLKQF